MYLVKIIPELNVEAVAYALVQAVHRFRRQIVVGARVFMLERGNGDDQVRVVSVLVGHILRLFREEQLQDVRLCRATWEFHWRGAAHFMDKPLNEIRLKL